MSVTAFCRLNVDFIYSGLERFPDLGEELYSKDLEIQLGGGATVIPIILSNLGIESKLGTFLGSGIKSSIAEQLLNKLNFFDYYNFHSRETCPVVITSAVSMKDDRAFISHCEDMKDDFLNKFDDDEKVYDFMTGSKVAFLAPAYSEVMSKIHNEGTFIVFDAGWNDIHDTQKLLRHLEHVDFYSPNDMEAMKITGTETPEEAVIKLAEYVKFPVVKIGAKGCLTYINNKVIHVDMPCKFNAIDMTGAGDNFLTGIVYGIHNEMDMLDCLKMGNIFGGNSTTELGCYKANISLTKKKIDSIWKCYT